MSTITQEIETPGTLSSLLAENTEKLLTCVHCGLCLPACPTYRKLGDENDSPRGRIYLMRGVVEGKVQLRDAFISHIDLCLGCRGCESVCPSGVPYGHLLEAARVEVATQKSARGSRAEFLLRFVLNNVFTRRWLLQGALAAARGFRDSGLARAIFRLNLLGRRPRFALALLIASRSPLSTRTEITRNPSSAGGSKRVALLHGCVMDGLFSATNRATERVLALNDCQLLSAPGQVCCGALHAHAGQLEMAKKLARANIEAFLETGAERIIVNAAGCGAAMKEYADLLADDPLYANRAKDFSLKVRDISEFLIEIDFKRPEGSVHRRVAYDAPCHLIHAQRIVEAPIEVLRAIPGVTLVPLRGFESCCGGAGVYNLQHQELSAEILDDKIASIIESGADTVVTANPGCIMQLGAGALLSGLRVDVVHPIELLDAAYGK